MAVIKSKTCTWRLKKTEEMYSKYISKVPAIMLFRGQDDAP